MGKANAFLDLFLHKLFYKNKFIVFVQKSNNNIEKHYYDVDEEGRVLIYKHDSEHYEKNPFFKGSAIHFDAKHKAPILLWREGENIAYPLFGTNFFDSQKVDSQYGFRMVNLGKRLEQLNNPIINLNKKENYILYVVLGSLVLGVINLLMVYQLAQHLGIDLLS